MNLVDNCNLKIKINDWGENLSEQFNTDNILLP